MNQEPKNPPALKPAPKDFIKEQFHVIVGTMRDVLLGSRKLFASSLNMLKKKYNDPVILERNLLKPNWLSFVYHFFLHDILFPLAAFSSVFIYHNIRNIINNGIIGTTYHQLTPHEFIASFIIGMLCLYATIQFKYFKLNKEANSYHNVVEELYERGFPLIREVIIHKMKENATRLPEGADRNRQKKYDEHIMSPLEYCKNLITGEHQPPGFVPDATYINNLFARQQVIAITGAPTAMWMDPTLVFYLVNSCLASLIGQINQEIKSRHENPDKQIEESCGLLGLLNFSVPQYNEHRKCDKDLLAKLATGTDFSLCGKFQARFFIINDGDIRTGRMLLDSLYALHELFGVRAYFVKEKALLKRLCDTNQKSEYINMINKVWNTIYSANEIIPTTNKLPDPEFLLFPCDINGVANAEVFTYYKSEPKNAYSKESIMLVKLLAKICHEVEYTDNEFWYKPDVTNQQYCSVHVV